LGAAACGAGGTTDAATPLMSWPHVPQNLNVAGTDASHSGHVRGAPEARTAAKLVELADGGGEAADAIAGVSERFGGFDERVFSLVGAGTPDGGVGVLKLFGRSEARGRSAPHPRQNL